MEEIGAIRLKDLEGLNQEEAAEKMNISRPTFQRILVEARQKIAESLIKGKAIRFQGGDYKLSEDIRCPRCGKDFSKKNGGADRSMDIRVVTVLNVRTKKTFYVIIKERCFGISYLKS